jgi:hypothetical protein
MVTPQSLESAEGRAKKRIRASQNESRSRLRQVSDRICAKIGATPQEPKDRGANREKKWAKAALP